MNFLNLQPDVAAIDVNDFSLRLAQLKKGRRGFQLVSWNEVALKSGVVKEGVIVDEEAFVKATNSLCGAVRGKKLTTRYVTVSLPEEKSFSQVISMPNMTEKELSSAVPFEAENYIPLTIDKVYLDFQVLPSNDASGRLEVLINVMPRPIVDSYLEAFKKAGLIPCIFEVEPQAIVRALTAAKEAGTPSMYVDFGRNNTTISMVADKVIRFTCSIPVTSQQLTEAISKSTDVSLSKAEDQKIKYGLLKKGEKKYDGVPAMQPVVDQLVSQIKKYLDFYRGHISSNFSGTKTNIEKVILCGGGANLKNLPEHLAKELKMPVELANPFTNILPQSRKSKAYLPVDRALSFITAFGLAMGGFSDSE